MPAPILRRDGKKSKILYIEDNPENRMLVRAILESEGYTIVDAEDGLSGIEAAVREEPALILLDVNLPAIAGARWWPAARATSRSRSTWTPFRGRSRSSCTESASTSRSASRASTCAS